MAILSLFTLLDLIAFVDELKNSKTYEPNYISSLTLSSVTNIAPLELDLAPFEGSLALQNFV